LNNLATRSQPQLSTTSANLGGQLGGLSSGVSSFPGKPAVLNALRCIRSQRARRRMTNGWAVGWPDLPVDAQAINSYISSNSRLGLCE
jgi:hypothetical protein